MKFPCMFENVAGLTLAVVSLLSTPVTAQTVISNETLVSSTLVVNKHDVSASCQHAHCSAQAPMFSAVPVICPAATGKTCTFHISLDSKVSIFSPASTFYQFLVDGAAPTIGPTGKHGGYLFSQNVLSAQGYVRQSYPASVVATVTNSNSDGHTILVSVGCATDITQGGCLVTAHFTTMRVDVFEP